MSGHIGLREESRAGHLLARRIALLFARPLPPSEVAQVESRICRRP